jgi:methylglyoxal reductase
MKYINLGSTNILVSVIGFGAWAIGGRWWGGTDVSESVKAIDSALDNGINFIDTAPAYGKGLSEEIIGKAIKNKREKTVLATKCGMVWHLSKNQFWYKYDDETNLYRNLSSGSIVYELENSLKRLKTDYIDLYQVHIPDADTPVSETMETLLRLKKEGKIRAIGVSNITKKDLIEYSQYGFIDTDQEKYSILDLDVEDEILPWCNQNGTTFLAYSPLSQGLLTGKISPDRVFQDDDIRIGQDRFRKKILKESIRSSILRSVISRKIKI